MRASDYLGPFGHLAAHVAGYEHRPSQLRMAEAVEQVLESEGVLLVEAGTGTGKTLAYLVPALLAGRRVVVSTGTKTLQDQIMEHDLPLLRSHLPVPVEAACMKGLDNYLCLRRFDELRHGAEAFAPNVARHLPLLERFRDDTATGDRGELDALPEDAAIWSYVKSGADTRIGAKCRYYDECFVTKMRRRAEDAQLIVVNHHLFFADLATRGPHGGVIPAYDTVIFDEAHQIEDVVTQFFGVQVSSTRLEVLVRDAQRALLGHYSPPTIASDVLRTAADLFAALPASLGAKGASEPGRKPLPRELFTGELERRAGELDAALEALGEHCKGKATESDAIAQLARRAGQVREDFETITSSRSNSKVAWAEMRGSRFSIGSSPVDVSTMLREELFYRTRSVVLTSATLSTGGSFSFIKQRLGIDFDVREEILPSPFDYPTQAALYVPTTMPDPRDGAFLDAAEREIRQLVALSGGGAFVLCTATRAMQALHARFKARPPVASGTDVPLPVLVQGEAPKTTLLDRFRDVRNAVLFATASFWEGVDVPGEALRLVIIDKLPFDVPTDPLIVARCERLREDGNEPFMRYLVPAAALALKQGFGRLVRTSSDRGIVAILDRRIVAKGYGKVFLKSLPDARRCETFAELEAFQRGELAREGELQKTELPVEPPSSEGPLPDAAQ